MLLKNVQDGISRPQGNRAIQKTKVETDLLDTLYVFGVSIACFSYLCTINNFKFDSNTVKSKNYVRFNCVKPH